MSMTKYKKKISFYSLLGKIGDILLWPVLVIALFSSFFMLVQRKQNKTVSIFGYSMCTVLSGSMTNDGFQKGDTIIVKKTSEKDIKLGDKIAFYKSTDKNAYDSDIHLIIRYRNSSYPLSNEDNFDYGLKDGQPIDISSIAKKYDKSAEYLQKAYEDKMPIIFHTVIGIYYDDDGNIYYKSKGSSNGTADGSLVRGDLLVGRYVNTPVAFRRVASFCGSPLGMIVLVCLPLSLLVLMQSLSIIEQVSIINLEKKLLCGQLSYKDDDIKKDLPGYLVEIYNKVYYYYITPNDEKDAVKEYLWKNLFSSNKLNKNDQKELNLVIESIKKLENSKEDYWNVWIDNYKGSTKKYLIKYKNEVLNNNVKDNIENTNKIIKTVSKKEMTQELNNNLSNKNTKNITMPSKNNGTINKKTIVPQKPKL